MSETMKRAGCCALELDFVWSWPLKRPRKTRNWTSPWLVFLLKGERAEALEELHPRLFSFREEFVLARHAR
jgi:hypothetical protein